MDLTRAALHDSTRGNPSVPRLDVGFLLADIAIKDAGVSGQSLLPPRQQPGLKRLESAKVA